MVSKRSSDNVRKSVGRARRGVATLGAISVLLVIGIPAAHADLVTIEDTWNGFTYTVVGGAATITRYDGPTAGLVIPATLGGVPTERIATRVFEREGLSGTLSLPDSVAFIDDYAFASNALITSVSFGTTQSASALTSIGVGAFAGVTSLAGSLTFPNSLTSIGREAFKNLVNVTSVSFGTSQTASALTTIGESTFYGMNLTGALLLPNSLTNLGPASFGNNLRLTSVALGTSQSAASLITIGQDAFDTTGLTGPLLLPNSLRTVGVAAFYALPNLTSISFESTPGQSNLTTIGDNAFFGGTGLTGNLFIPDSVTTIGANAFQSAGSMNLRLGTSISASQLTSIGSAAFGFPGINTSLEIPDKVITIGDSAFFPFANLSQLTVGSRISAIGASVFARAPFNAITFTGNAPASIGEATFVSSITTTFTRWQGSTGWGSTYSTLPRAFVVAIAAPTVTTVSPASGSITGNQLITITGTGFATGASVTMGTPASSVSVVNSRTITARTPMHAAGAVDITVTNPPADELSRSGSLVDAYTYMDQVTPPVNGGREPVPTPTATVLVSQLAQPVPTELSPGVGSLLINGVATPVVVEKSADGKDVIISGGGVRLVLSATGVNGQPVPLGPDGSLVVSAAGGIPMVGSGFAAGSTVTLFMFSTPVTLGTATVNAAGAYSTTAVIPGSTTTGSHTIQVVGTSTAGQPIALSLGVTVKSAATGTVKPSVHVARSRTHLANGRVSVEARGVQVGCSVKFWVKGSTSLAKAGKAGIARATLKAPSAQGNWSVTATTSGNGCSQSTSSTRLLVR